MKIKQYKYKNWAKVPAELTRLADLYKYLGHTIIAINYAHLPLITAKGKKAKYTEMIIVKYEV